jgi:hypothetical protein
VLCQQQQQKTGQQQQQKTGQQQQRPAATQHPGKHRKQLPTTTAHNRDKHWLSRGQHVRMPCPKGNLQCKAMSDMLAQLEFQQGFGPRVNCTCAQFDAGVCFAPGCFPCARSCLPKELAALPGPFGTGLLCSSGGFRLCTFATAAGAAPAAAAAEVCSRQFHRIWNQQQKHQDRHSRSSFYHICKVRQNSISKKGSSNGSSVVQSCKVEHFLFWLLLSCCTSLLNWLPHGVVTTDAWSMKEPCDSLLLLLLLPPQAATLAVKRRLTQLRLQTAPATCRKGAARD